MNHRVLHTLDTQSHVPVHTHTCTTTRLHTPRCMALGGFPGRRLHPRDRRGSLLSSPNTARVVNDGAAPPSPKHQVLQEQLVAYLQAQHIMMPCVLIAIFAAVVNLLGGVFVVLGAGIREWHGLGFAACPWVTTCTQWLSMVVLVSVVFLWRRMHVPTWPGWAIGTNVTRTRVLTFLQLYVPAMLQFGSEFWR